MKAKEPFGTKLKTFSIVETHPHIYGERKMKTFEIVVEEYDLKFMRVTYNVKSKTEKEARALIKLYCDTTANGGNVDSFKNVNHLEESCENCEPLTREDLHRIYWDESEMFNIASLKELPDPKEERAKELKYEIESTKTKLLSLENELAELKYEN